jgi:hypothetical protein
VPEDGEAEVSALHSPQVGAQAVGHVEGVVDLEVRELDLLKAPAGMPATRRTSDVTAEHVVVAQEYCVPAAEEGRRALDSMFRAAGWELLSSSTTANGVSWWHSSDVLHGGGVAARRIRSNQEAPPLGAIASLRGYLDRRASLGMPSPDGGAVGSRSDSVGTLSQGRGRAR